MIIFIFQLRFIQLQYAMFLTYLSSLTIRMLSDPLFLCHIIPKQISKAQPLSNEIVTIVPKLSKSNDILKSIHRKKCDQTQKKYLHKDQMFLESLQN